MISNSKMCTKCKQTKPLIAFGTNGKSKSGKPKIRSHCRSCHAERDRRGVVTQVAASPQENVQISNAFALWFGPVLRRIPLSWRP